MPTFGRRARSCPVPPALVQVAEVNKLREDVDAEVGSGFGRRGQRVGNTLIEIMNCAKLRQIPRVYETEYSDVLEGTADAHGALLALQEAVDADDLETKDRALAESVRLSRTARFKLLRAQRFLGGG